MSSPFDPFKVDYSNFYKFVSSVGLVLIAAAAALPWFVMKAAIPDVDPASPASAVVDEAVSARAEQYLLAVKSYPIVSIGLLVLGLLLTGYGLIAWKNRQKKQDDDEDETFRQRRKLGLTTQASEDEKENKLEEEVEAADSDASEPSAQLENKDGPADSKSAIAEETARSRNLEDAHKRREVQRELIRQYESQVGEFLRTGFGDTHSLEAGVRLSSSGGGVQNPILDFVARAHDSKRWTSFAVEVRVVPSGPLMFMEWLRRSMMSVAIAAREVPEGPVPRGSVGRPVIARSVTLSVMVVPPDAGIRSKMWERFVLHAQVINSVMSRQVALMVVSGETLERANPSDFHHWVLGLLQDPTSPFIDPAVRRASESADMVQPISREESRASVG